MTAEETVNDCEVQVDIIYDIFLILYSCGAKFIKNIHYSLKFCSCCILKKDTDKRGSKHCGKEALMFTSRVSRGGGGGGGIKH